eukprot:SAG11_NODE_38083_length_254_cov_0.567742_1_plen_40_part_10
MLAEKAALGEDAVVWVPTITRCEPQREERPEANLVLSAAR